ncbi:4-fold beta flower protein [Aestuariivivens sediminis]|uniref:4-fold beta flower protein n=1 Tax=Aestuariivivens sediminis TaxID=2913557 RepID=UPI003B8A6227
MQSIYNNQGKTVGWLSFRDLYDLSGTYIGFIKGHGVYNMKSKYCGTLRQSAFRDREGLVVAFMKGAKNTPVLPSLKPSPSEPPKKSKPSLKPTVTPPPRKSDRLQWSKIDWDRFIS